MQPYKVDNTVRLQPDPIWVRIYSQMSPRDKKVFAEGLGTSTNYLRHIRHGRREFSPKRALQAVEVLRDMGYKGVRPSWMRPDLWGEWER